MAAATASGALPTAESLGSVRPRTRARGHAAMNGYEQRIERTHVCHLPATSDETLCARVCICALGAAIALERSGMTSPSFAPSQGSITYTTATASCSEILGRRDRRTPIALRSTRSLPLPRPILAAEDARFWRHGAVDVRALPAPRATTRSSVAPAAAGSRSKCSSRGSSLQRRRSERG